MNTNTSVEDMVRKVVNQNRNIRISTMSYAFATAKLERTSKRKSK